MITFAIHEPFEQGLRSVRRILKEHSWNIPAELDISRSVKEELGLDAGPCRILCIDCPLLLETMVIDRTAGILLPLHVVLSARDASTLVHVLGPAAVRGTGLSIGVAIPLMKLLNRLAESLSCIGVRCEPRDWN
jgi:uncharacterized protein (DUF302 family)